MSIAAKQAYAADSCSYFCNALKKDYNKLNRYIKRLYSQ